MELRETIESINFKLGAEFGRAYNGEPNFRVVFSEDQFEKRRTNYTDDGFELLIPEVRMLPKYRQHIQQKYILERLIPIIGETDLIDPISYEPAWVFQDKDGNYLPPFFDGCKLIIETIYAQIDKKQGFAKYKDDSILPEVRKQKLDEMQKDLFGNDTDVSDALHYGYGVAGFRSKIERGEQTSTIAASIEKGEE